MNSDAPSSRQSTSPELCTVTSDATGTTFLLRAGGASYGLHVADYGVLYHGYWGAPLAALDRAEVERPRERCLSPNPVAEDKHFSLDTVPQEYPSYGRSDFRSPALAVVHPSTGARVTDLRYAGHRIESDKPKLEGLPATLAEADGDAVTLVVTLRDEAVHVAVELSYTVFAHHPVIARSARILNEGTETLRLERALSCSVDLPARFFPYHFVHLHGAWTRETQLAVTPIRPGMQSVESRRGASSPNHNPFFALTELPAHEEFGDAYGFNLIYSGNFLAAVEADAYEGVRAQLGLNPFDFGWELEPGAAFQTPEAVMAYSGEGLGGLSRALHRFYRQHLVSKTWRDRPRPVVINSWEGVYFNFDADKIEAIAKEAAPLGMELLVLDDGWFGRRDDPTSSLGDWTPDLRKLPKGLPDLVERVRAQGLEFGLWFEPEMVSPDSDLFRAHPDWCLHVPTHSPSVGRHQLILDLSRPEVVDELFRRLADVLSSAPISYVKWDMNRHMSEIGSAGRAPGRQRETAHRYMLGLYSLLERLTTAFPSVLFEGCSSGGGRFDPGILAYMPQNWTSDNTDAVARLRIQYGTSVVYPFSTLSAHVSVVPSHATGRSTPFLTRNHVAFTGAFGYELDPASLSDEEKAETRRQVDFYKSVRELLLLGDLYRLCSPFAGNRAAWMVVSPDRREALATHVTVLTEANPRPMRLVLRGLDPDGVYEVSGLDHTLRGDYLMQAGLRVAETHGDFVSQQWHLRQV